MSDLSAEPANGLPRIHTMTLGDLAAALKAGFRDFLRAPLFGLAIGGVFASIGMVIVASLTIWQLPWLIYPFGHPRDFAAALRPDDGKDIAP